MMMGGMSGMMGMAGLSARRQKARRRGENQLGKMVVVSDNRKRAFPGIFEHIPLDG
jgi:hypothetical protein